MAAGDAEFSAGGVLLRGDDVVVIVPERSGPRGRPVLALPKGHPEPGESAADAAAREVREETGVQGDLLGKLGDVRYWYQRDGLRVPKVVSFFLFRYTAGDTADHDHEVLEARWMPLADAAVQLTFPGEREMARQALSNPLRDR